MTCWFFDIPEKYVAILVSCLNEHKFPGVVFGSFKYDKQQQAIYGEKEKGATDRYYANVGFFITGWLATQATKIVIPKITHCYSGKEFQVSHPALDCSRELLHIDDQGKETLLGYWSYEGIFHPSKGYTPCDRAKILIEFMKRFFI